MASPIWSSEDLQFVSHIGIDAFDLAEEEAQRIRDRDAAVRAFYRQARSERLEHRFVFMAIVSLIVAFWVAVGFTIQHWINKF